MSEGKIVIVADSDNKKTNNEQQLKEQKISKLRSLSGVFSRALSVIAGRRVNVSVVDEPQNSAPAWSSTSNVTINASHIQDITAKTIVSLNGLIFHELSHIRYSPRTGTKLVQEIQNAKNSQELWQSFNALDDMRIENLIVAYLPSVKNWLIATISEYLLTNDEAITNSFPLIYGRYYLPDTIRQLSIDEFTNPEMIDELKDVIDQYTGLIIDDTNWGNALSLIEQYAKLLRQLNTPNGCDIFGHDSRPTNGYESSATRPAPTPEQIRDLQKALQEKKVKVSISRNKPKAGNSAPADISQVKEIVISAGDDQSSFDFDSDDLSELDSPNQNGYSESDSGTKKIQQQITDSISDELEKAMQDLAKEINSIAKQAGLNNLLADGNSDLQVVDEYKEISAPAHLVSLSREFAKELERLKADHDPAWIRYQDSGKVNAYRFVTTDDYETMFDSWHEGRDNVLSIQSVIMLDKSGSMEGENASNAYQSMWAIKKSLDSINAKTDVLVFDSYSQILYRNDEKISNNTIRNCGAFGGTNPYTGLRYAKSVFANSDKKIKILFLITDGQFSDESDSLVIQMRNAGILTAQCHINQSGRLSDEARHGFELMSAIKSAKDILTLGKELVRIAINKNLVKQ